MHFSCNALIFDAPTVIAIAIASLSCSSVNPDFLATARQYSVHGSHPDPREAPSEIIILVLESKAPS
jgi:hypothetical protein